MHHIGIIHKDKPMKKYLAVLTTLAFIPSVAFAAWWNPFTWFGTTPATDITDTKTAALEQQITELENKVNSIASSTASTTATSTMIFSTASSSNKTPAMSTVAKNSNNENEQAQIKIDEQNAQIKAQENADQQSTQNTVAPTTIVNPTPPTPVENNSSVNMSEGVNATPPLSPLIVGSPASQSAQNTQSQENTATSQKQAQLDAINQQIAALNAKYAADIKAAQNSGATMDQSAASVQYINSQYTNNYDALEAQYQAIYYGN